ncbi:MAG TPA: amidase, partial [Trueperaceae bacterium]|nr:amidase [Trueperaceae bacterium]
IRERRLSPLKLTQRLLAGIDQLDGSLTAYITVCHERAVQEAADRTAELDDGDYRGPLHGIPIAHKDLIATRGVRTTYHTDHFKDYVPSFDAPVVERLRKAGTVLLGKANTLELGSGDGPVFGLARNPWDPERQVGGSSSGSAVAVAAGLAVAATGSDAGGSIRIPASFCGIVGLKPTAGLVYMGEGKNGISVTGPMTRTVTDCAVLLEAMAGIDGLIEQVTGDVRGLTVGVPVDWVDTPLEDDIAEGFHASLDTLRSSGAKLIDVRLPHAEASETLGALITHVDCFGKYRFLLDARAKLSPFFHELLLATELYTASDYMAAQRMRRLMISDVVYAHAQVDVMVTPTVPFRTARLDQMEFVVAGRVVNARTGQGRFTRLSNLTGYPSLSVPVGLDSNGMPLSVQLHGRPFEEGTLLRTARALELANSQRAARPRIHI